MATITYHQCDSCGTRYVTKTPLTTVTVPKDVSIAAKGDEYHIKYIDIDLCNSCEGKIAIAVNSTIKAKIKELKK